MMMKKKILIIITALTLVFSINIIAFADDDTENYSEDNSQQDYSDSERINALEIRLQDLGFTVDEIQTILNEIRENLTSEELLRMDISDKLDILIMLLQRNFDTQNEYNDEVLTPFLDDINKHNSQIDLTIKENFEKQIKETVSGNSILTDFDEHINENLKLLNAETIGEFNTTLSRTNYFLACLLVILIIALVLFIGLAILKPVKDLISRNL